MQSNCHSSIGMSRFKRKLKLLLLIVIVISKSFARKFGFEICVLRDFFVLVKG